VRLHHQAVSVKADDQRLYFEALGMHAHGRKKVKLTFQGAAEFAVNWADDPQSTTLNRM